MNHVIILVNFTELLSVKKFAAKKFIIILSIIVLCAFLSYKSMFLIRNKVSLYTGDGISYMSKVDNKSFYIYKYGKGKRV